jgi:hypothetical protein
VNLHPSSPGTATRRGLVLVAVLIFVMLLGMVIASLLFQSAADESAASASASSEQAWAAALSGVAEVLRIAPNAGGPDLDWQDNPARFKHQLVHDDGADRWYFTVFTPAAADSLATLRYGLSDEASKVNLRHATIDQLSKIPRITPELARALFSSVPMSPDAPQPATNSSPSFSTESSSTESTDPFVTNDVPSDPDPALSADTGPIAIDSIEDLLQIPGLTPSLLLGEDLNQNGRLDPGEDLNQDDNLDRGLAQYLTLDSSTPNVSRSGERRVRLNDPSDPLPAVDLPPGFTNFITSLRNAKQSLGHPADALEASLTLPDAQGNPTPVASEITLEHLPVLLDRFTTSSRSNLPALINLNTASTLVLASVPDIDLPLAESIVSTRTALSPDRRESIAWLLQEGVVNTNQFKSIAPHLTARSHQFTCRIAGYGVPSGRFRVLELSVSTSSGPPRITRLRDVSRFGFPLPAEIIDDNPPDSAPQALIITPIPHLSSETSPGRPVFHRRHG